MDQGFFGAGWKCGLTEADAGITLDASGRVAEASGEDKIRQSIWLILSTAPGERVARPDFGCGIHDLVFSPRTVGAMGEVIRAVREALTAWEPRIDVTNVDAVPHPDDPSGLLIVLEYTVRATNSRQNLVYPFYAAP
jgi:hypothetical protein